MSNNLEQDLIKKMNQSSIDISMNFTDNLTSQIISLSEYKDFSRYQSDFILSTLTTLLAGLIYDIFREDPIREEFLNDITSKVRSLWVDLKEDLEKHMKEKKSNAH